MTTAAGVGVSHHRNPRVAAEEAYSRAIQRAGIEGRPDFVLLFASVGYPQEAIVTRVRELSGEAPLAGCSAEGVITQGEADESNFSIGVLAVRSDEIHFHAASAGGMKAAPYANGKAIAEALRDQLGQPVIGMLLLADGIGFNYDKFTAGFQDHIRSDQNILMFGGMASDNWALQKTYQYHDGQVISDGAVAVLMTGSLRAAYSVNHGCAAIGMERKVTRCRGNVIYEIDHQPVLDILKEYLGPDEIDNWNQTVVNLSWGLKAAGNLQDGYDELVIRFMPAKDDATGSITISTEVQEGTSIWMTRRDQEKIAIGVQRIGDEVQAQLQGKTPKLVFHFDCCGRGKVVFRDQQKLDILASLQHTLGTQVPWLGLYVYGEIGPVGTCNYFHNYTLSLVALY